MGINANQELEDQPEASLNRFEPPIAPWSKPESCNPDFAQISPQIEIITQNSKLILDSSWNSGIEYEVVNKGGKREIYEENFQIGSGWISIWVWGWFYRERWSEYLGVKLEKFLVQIRSHMGKESSVQIPLDFVEKWSDFIQPFHPLFFAREWLIFQIESDILNRRWEADSGPAFQEICWGETGRYRVKRVTLLALKSLKEVLICCGESTAKRWNESFSMKRVVFFSRDWRWFLN